ncbi:MAG: hypothetical protein EZS28_027844, partial [Streblomastix strix]
EFVDLFIQNRAGVQAKCAVYMVSCYRPQTSIDCGFVHQEPNSELKESAKIHTKYSRKFNNKESNLKYPPLEQIYGLFNKTGKIGF